MDPLKQAELMLRQYQQWLADAQLQNAQLAADNALLREAMKPKDPNEPEASSGLVE